MYSTIDDIRKQIREAELIGLTDDEDTGAVVEERVTTAIADADAEIDGLLGGRYTVPFSPVPEIVRKWSVDIAIYNLYARGAGAPEIRKDRYNGAINLIKSVAKGDITLGADDPAGTGQADNPAVSGGDRIFTTDTLKGF